MTNIPQKKNLERLLVTVDKSHLITIGEKLYSESIELIRELINNSYDADATLVEVTITPQKIEIKDATVVLLKDENGELNISRLIPPSEEPEDEESEDV